MTALSGGDKLEDKPSPESSMFERPDTIGGEMPSGARSLDRIFPLQADPTRGRQMQETWLAFCSEREAAVRAVLDKGGSPPEIAYAIGELVHNTFRTRGVTLTSFELRRLVVEVLDLQRRRRAQVDKHAGVPLVVFTDEPVPTATPWTGDEPAAPAPQVVESTFQAPPSPLVDLSVRDAISFDRLLATVVAGARTRLTTGPASRADRAVARGVIEAVLAEVLQDRAGTMPAEARERMVLLALSEVCGLGLIDRLWADRAIRTIVVNGATAVYVERNGVLEPAPEQFLSLIHI